MKKLLIKIRYKLEYYLFIFLIKLLQLLSIDITASICAFIATKIGPILPITQVVKKNLKIAFPRLNWKKEKVIIQLLWNNFGRFIGEFPHLETITEAEINGRVKITGLKHLKNCQQLNRPFFIFTGHFANWEFVLKKINKLYAKFAIIYRQVNNPFINQYIINTRQNNNLILIEKGKKSIVNLIKAIKSNCSIAILADQKMNEGIEIPFFNQLAMTAPAIAKLSLKLNYPIFPVQIVRKKQTSYFHVIIHPALKIKKTDQPETNIYNIMLSINKYIETWIKKHPEQWFWFHQRWKKYK